MRMMIMMRLTVMAALLLVVSIDAFSLDPAKTRAVTTATPTTKTSNKSADWIAEQFHQDAVVVQGPKHVLMYDTTLRGKCAIAASVALAS